MIAPAAAVDGWWRQAVSTATVSEAGGTKPPRVDGPKNAQWRNKPNEHSDEHRSRPAPREAPGCRISRVELAKQSQPGPEPSMPFLRCRGRSRFGGFACGETKPPRPPTPSLRRPAFDARALAKFTKRICEIPMKSTILEASEGSHERRFGEANPPGWTWTRPAILAEQSHRRRDAAMTPESHRKAPS